jgi:DNA-binding NarL/FixJ family response regulator
MVSIAPYCTEPSSSDVAAEGDVIAVGLLHPKQALLDALEVLLAPHPDIKVVAAHTDLEWIRHAVTAGDVNVLLIDGNGHVDDPAVIRSLRSASSGLGVVIIADAEERATLADVVRAGVRGWVGRDGSVDDLVQVIRGVYRGETWFPPSFTTKVLDALLAEERLRREARGLLESLSSREQEVLRCLMKGISRQQIAERFVLSPHTVRTHVNNLLRKLEVHSTLAAVSIARQAGLSDDEEI